MKCKQLGFLVSFLLVLSISSQIVSAFGIGDVIGIENRTINQLIIIGIICFSIMMISAHFLEREAEKIGAYLGSVIGIMMVAAMTSVPELAVALNSAFSNHIELAVGTIIGSNIANIALVLGMAAILRPVEIEKGFFKSIFAFIVILVGLVVILFNLRIIPPTFIASRVSEMAMFGQEGIIMIMFFVLYILFSNFIMGKKEIEEEKEKSGQLSRHILLVAILGLTIWFLAELTVTTTIKIAEFYNISELIIGVVILAVGTSLPEIGVTLVGVIKKKYDFIITDLIGSNAFDMAVCLGLASFIVPVTISKEVLYFHIPFLIFVNFLTMILIMKNFISRKSGFILLSVYLVYILLTFVGITKFLPIY